MSIQVNYPATTFHLNDTTTSDLSASGLRLYDASDNLLSMLTQTSIKINDATQNSVNMLASNSHSITTGDVTGTGQAARTILGSIQLNFQSFTDGVQTSSTVLSKDTLVSDVSVFDVSLNALTLGGVASTEGQVISANANGKPVWTTLPSEVIPTLQQVLTAGSDANNQPINDLSLVAFQKVAGGAEGDDVLELTGVNPDPSTYTTDLLNINTPANTTRATKQFSGNYLPLSVGGTVYWVQLFSAPA